MICKGIPDNTKEVTTFIVVVTSFAIHEEKLVLFLLTGRRRCSRSLIEYVPY